MLAKALKDERSFIASAARDALEELGPPAKEAVPTLIELLEDADDSGDWLVEDALESITGQKLGENASAWRKWWEENK